MAKGIYFIIEGKVTLFNSLNELIDTYEAGHVLGFNEFKEWYLFYNPLVNEKLKKMNTISQLKKSFNNKSLLQKQSQLEFVTDGMMDDKIEI